MSPAVSDPVGSVIAAALDGLSVRQSVIADNIANVDTPGYRASSVDFETQLRAAIADGGLSGSLQPVTTATNTPVGANDNNVDLRKETMAAIQTQFQYQVLTRAASDRFALVRDVAEGI